MVDIVLLNVHEENIKTNIWKNLREIYKAKSLVNKIFLRNNLYTLRMKDGESIVEHINSFNMVVTQLHLVGVKMDEHWCMNLLYSLSNSWDHLFIAIGSTTTNFKKDEVVASLLSKEMRRNSFQLAIEALEIHGTFK